MQKKDQKRLERNTRRALLRKQKKLKRRVSREEAYATKISMVPAWKRVLIFVLSSPFMVLTIWSYGDGGPHWLTVLFLLTAITIILLSIFGGRKTIDGALQAFGDSAGNKIVDSIIDSLI